MKEYILHGIPIPLARPRFGSHGKIYDCQKIDKEHARELLMMQHLDEKLYSGPLRLYVDFYMPIASTYSKKKQVSFHGIYHIFKPDLSNLLKFVEDVATGILFSNDCLIAEVITTKKHDNEPRTIFRVEELKNKKVPNEKSE